MGTRNIDWFHDLISEMRIELEEDEYIILEECKEATESEWKPYQNCGCNIYCKCKEANYINDLDKEASLRWICAVIEKCTMDIKVTPIEKLLDVLFDIERNERD